MSNTQFQDHIIHKRRVVARWLMLGVIMIVVQILLGGITRLTGSGLSIAEWKPILGAVPPMNDQEWHAAFELYKVKAAGQFLNHNSDYTLSDFKAIYFWEWCHREWARLLGIVFILGFSYFLVKKYFDKKMLQPFVILFLLGALQGAVGWIMVASGLNPDDTHVSHIKLALHFMFALVLLVYTYWFALKLKYPTPQTHNTPKLKTITFSVLILLSVQCIYGAFMAGLRAAPVAPTWPDINGAWGVHNPMVWAGETLSFQSMLTDHPLVVQWIHRALAYTLLILIMLLGFQLYKKTSKSQNAQLYKAIKYPIILVVLQVIFGILTVINGTLMTQSKFQKFELLAEGHQMIAIFLLMSLVYLYYLLSTNNIKEQEKV